MKRVSGLFYMAFLLHSLSNLATATAASVNIMSNLKCYCLTFHPSQGPTPCKIAESQGLDWDKAQAFASKNRLKLHFASESTVSRILDSDVPLPTTVLRMASGAPSFLDDKQFEKVTTRVVCGIDDEVRQWWLKKSELSGKTSDWFVLQVVLALILFIGLYMAGEAIWMR